MKIIQENKYLDTMKNEGGTLFKVLIAGRATFPEQKTFTMGKMELREKSM